MRFLSKHARYQTWAWSQKVERLADGNYRELDPGFLVQFEQGVLMDNEVEAVRRSFRWSGLPTLQDKVTIIDPTKSRVGVFDTALIFDEGTKKRVEAALLANPEFGNDFICVEEVRLPAPWPKYDDLVAVGRRTVEMVAAKIRETVDELGLEPADVAAYERENLNRPEVLAALEAEEPVEKVVEVAA